MNKRLIVCCVLLAGLLGACAPPTLYKWGAYDQALYNYYQDPEAIEALVEAIEANIQDAEKTKQVPPGMYAEYGFLLMTKNQNQDAIVYFNKEKTSWPESTILMTKMIATAQANDKRQQR